jgi:hypothetical protein
MVDTFSGRITRARMQSVVRLSRPSKSMGRMAGYVCRQRAAAMRRPAAERE